MGRLPMMMGKKKCSKKEKEEKIRIIMFGSVPGRRFIPTDYESITDFLICKVRGEAVPYRGFVMEADLYGYQEPWELFASHTWAALNQKTSSRYFFTTLKREKKKKNKYIINRSVGKSGGRWKVKNNGCPVRDPFFIYEHDILGWKKTLVYENHNHKDHDDDDVQWLMTEYSLHASSLQQSYYHSSPSKCLDYVLCRIKKKKIIKKEVVLTNTDDDKFLEYINRKLDQSPDVFDDDHFFSTTTSSNIDHEREAAAAMPITDDVIEYSSIAQDDDDDDNNDANMMKIDDDDDDDGQYYSGEENKEAAVDKLQFYERLSLQGEGIQH